MTPEQIEMHRIRFEELYLPKFGWHKCFERAENGKYFYSEVQSGFDCYLLCAENIEIELPDMVTNKDGLSAYYMGYNDAIEDCHDRLESQGIKVKP